MRTPDKNRYLQAVRHVETGEVPFQETEFARPISEGLLGKSLPPVRCYELPGRDVVDLYRSAGCDMAYLACIWELGRKNFIDEQGREHYVDGLFKTRESLLTLSFPDFGTIRRRLDDVSGALSGTGLGLIYAPNPVPFMVTTAMGYQDYYEGLLLNPGFALEFQRRLWDWCMGELDLAMEYPVDVIRIGAVLCTKQGPMMSRDALEQFEYPFLREAARRIHARGRLAMLHSDGDLRALMPDLVAMGFNILHPIEPCDGEQDICAYKARYGDRLALHGNLDVGSVLAPCTPDEVRRATQAHVKKLSPGGGFICGSSHDISGDVPLPNLIAMRDAVHEQRV